MQSDMAQDIALIVLGGGSLAAAIWGASHFFQQMIDRQIDKRQKNESFGIDIIDRSQGAAVRKTEDPTRSLD